MSGIRIEWLAITRGYPSPVPSSATSPTRWIMAEDCRQQGMVWSGVVPVGSYGPFAGHGCEQCAGNSAGEGEERDIAYIQCHLPYRVAGGAWASISG